MKIRFVLSLMLLGTVLACLGGLPVGFYGGDNLVPAVYFKNDLSFYNRGLTWGKQVVVDDKGVVSIGATGKGIPAHASLWGLRPHYLLDGDSTLDISFEYRTASAGRFVVSFMRNENGVSLRDGTRGKRLQGYSGELGKADGWTPFGARVQVPLGADAAQFSFMRPKSGALSIRRMRIREVYPLESEGRRLLINGKECQGIYWMRTQDPFTDYDYLAAKMLSFSLRRCGGKVVPVREVKGKEDFQHCGVYVGQAAVASGLELPKGITAGGASIKVAGHRAGISGHRYFGAGFGAWTFLREQLGISYLGNNHFSYPEKGDYEVRDLSYVANPRIGIRYPYCSIVDRPELRGFCPPLIAQQELVHGNRGGAGHPGLAIASFDEFGKSHPEYFALQKDGSRLKSRNAHFCNTNEEFIKLFANRVLETMRAHPYCMVYRVYAGDGGGMSCQCPTCRALGNHSDMFVYFANRVAEITSKEFPDNYVATISYVDTTEPPSKIKPHKNVVVLYTHYEPRAWGAQQNYKHEFNDMGRTYLTGWEKWMPENMALEGHFSLYSEILNVYPQFYFIEAMVKRAALRNYKVMDTFYYNTPYGEMNGSQSFCELAYYMMGRLMADPHVNVEASIDWFMEQYYGPAAKTMRTYFNLIQQENFRQNWAQFCEQTKRGFVTQKLGEQGMALLSQAEKEAGDNVAFRKHVLREQVPFLFSYLSDVCRGRGNVTRANIDFYASALQRFCKVSKELQTLIYGGGGPVNWFKNTAMITIGKVYYWYLDAMVEEIMADPIKALGTLPRLQEKTADGWLIPPKGLYGGEKMQTNWQRKENGWAACVRRPIFGGGISTVLVKVHLDKKPDGASSLVLHGLDNEKVDRATMELRVNDRTIYKGVVPWGKKEWSRQTFSVPAGLLRQGENDVVILNTTQEKEAAALCGAAFNHQTPSRSNLYWGWFMVDQLELKAQK